MNQETIARKTFELENEVEEEILTFNDDENQKHFENSPWKKE
jgi:hypothetical protein